MEKDAQTYSIIGAAMEVHKELGCGFLEAVYQEALALEFRHCGIPFFQEVPLKILYKNQLLGCLYKADFVCFDSVLVELKAVETLIDSHRAQVINYLNATRYSRALLLNFGSPNLQYERLILTIPKKTRANSQA